MLVRFTCEGCNRQWIIPAGGQGVTCICGHVAEASSGPRYTRGLGDDIADAIDWLLIRLRIRKPKKCGCGSRQQKLNELDRRFRARLYRIACYLHPQ